MAVTRNRKSVIVRVLAGFSRMYLKLNDLGYGVAVAHREVLVERSTVSVSGIIQSSRKQKERARVKFWVLLMRNVR